MKNLVATLVLSMGVLTASFAQKLSKEDKKNMTSEQRVEHRLKKMTKDLTLTEEQISKIKPILLTQEEKRKALKEKQKALKEEKKEVRKEKRKEAKEEKNKKREAFKNEIKQILDAKQFEIFEKLKEEKKKKRKGRK